MKITLRRVERTLKKENVRLVVGSANRVFLSPTQVGVELDVTLRSPRTLRIS